MSNVAKANVRQLKGEKEAKVGVFYINDISTLINTFIITYNDGTYYIIYKPTVSM